VSQSNERSLNQAESPVPSRPIEVVGDDHGRPLTTNATAAAWYRAAQGSVVDGAGPDPALRRALEADPTFAVAACDLLALTDDPPPVDPARPATSWERHHCEIVTEAHRDVGRASGILREHLAVAGCDPLAVHIVCTALRTAGHNADRIADLVDLVASIPDCHAPTNSPTV
jgi:hypothetical protein